MSDYESIKDFSSIDVFIKYDFLPIHQYSEILSSMHGIYESLCELYYDKLFSPPELFWLRPPPLCVKNINTENSIFSKIAFDEIFFPKLDTSDAGKLELHLPKWSSILILTGMILYGGLELQGKYLHNKQLHLQNKKIEREIDHLDLKRLKDPSNPAANFVTINLHQYYFQINQENITEVYINGEKPLINGAPLK